MKIINNVKRVLSILGFMLFAAIVFCIYVYIKAVIYICLIAGTIAICLYLGRKIDKLFHVR